MARVIELQKGWLVTSYSWKIINNPNRTVDNETLSEEFSVSDNLP